jgi:hypothetical protein
MATIKRSLSEIKSIDTPNGNYKPVDNRLREHWNQYVDWLEKKGMKGSPALDKGDLGGKMIDIYRMENPTTLVSRQSIVPIQNEFSKYRQYTLNEIRNKRAELAPGVKEEDFMKNLSIVDNIPGQRTTSFKFPDEYLKTFLNGQLVGTEKKGFATVNK